MLVNKALDTQTPVLTKRQPLNEALQQMDILKVTVLPVIEADTGKLSGQVERYQLDEADGDAEMVKDLALQEPVKIFKRQHLFNAIQLMLEHEMALLPVIDNNWIFKGIIHKQHVLESLTDMLNITEFGSIITVELSRKDFTLSEIVQIIETEGGRILGITVETPDAEKATYEVSLKLNLKDVRAVSSSLRRHDYDVITEAESDREKIDLETRAEELIKYLDV